MNAQTRGLALAAAVLLGSAGAASAHAHLKTATPAMDATVAATPTELRLGFSEGVDAKFTGLTLNGPAGAVPTGAATLAPGDDKVLVVPLAGALAPGRYRVDWHALATDGHKTKGAYGFTVAP